MGDFFFFFLVELAINAGDLGGLKRVCDLDDSVIVVDLSDLDKLVVNIPSKIVEYLELFKC